MEIAIGTYLKLKFCSKFVKKIKRLSKKEMLKVQILVRKSKISKRKRKELKKITRSFKKTKLETKLVIINL